MARTLMYDPGTMQARSQWLAGLTEICSKMSGVLNMEVGTFTDLVLPEVAISPDDRGRLYQAPLGNKLWLQQPPPVIMRNGEVIDPVADNFEIDYLGGSIAFNPEYRCEEEDVITASASYIIDKSSVIDSLVKQVDDLSNRTGSFQGSFSSLANLVSAIEEGEEGYYAIVQDEATIYVWSTESESWVDVYKETDLSDYVTTSDIKDLLDGATSNDYYYSGAKTWVSIFDKILGAVLTGLVTTDASKVKATDTLLTAVGKLQAQISANIHAIYGDSEPTASLEGKIGQDYVDTSSGKKYHLVSVNDGEYIWEQYVSQSDLDTLNSTLKKEIEDTDTSLRKYVDDSIRESIYDSWAASY